MNLQENWNCIIQACNAARLTKQERIDVDASLQVIVGELNAYEKLKKEEMARLDKKSKELDKQTEEMYERCEEKTDEESIE